LKKTIITFLFLNLCLNASLLKPQNGELLFKTHVLFEWEQIQNANSYQIQICSDNEFSNCFTETNTTSLIYIEKQNIEWDTSYYWRVRPQFLDLSMGDWIDNFSFQTSIKLGTAYSIEHNNDETQNGLTAFGSFFDYYSAVIDSSGKEIWNSGNSDFVFYSSNEFGQLFGSLNRPELENNLPGVELQFTNEVIWQEPNDHFLHHEFIQLPNGNYMGVVETSQFGPIPFDGCYCSWTPLFQAIGYQADGVTPEFNWVGDRIVEWDAETGEEVWSWSVFDHYNMNDYDAIGGTWMEAYSAQRYDWTHVNAFVYNEAENAIYISSRHLSRITKISYPDGNIIWNMGIEHGSGDIDFGTDLHFSFQHSLQILPNGNITTLDNGNLSQSLLDTDYPTTRALEIEIINNGDAQIIWEYTLPQDLFGFASGNVQKLVNDNFLITTVGSGGTSLEINQQNEIVWEGKYNLTLPAGAVYRAQRIPGLHPGHFSFILPHSTQFENNIIEVNSENNSPELTIINESEYNEIYLFQLQGDGYWFENQSFEFELNPAETMIIQLQGNVEIDSGTHILIATVTPNHFPNLSKEFSLILIYSELSNINSVPNQISLNTYPNPFNGQISINYFVSHSSIIDGEIRNINGEIINKLNFGLQQLGQHQFNWEAINIPSGTYFLSIGNQNYKQIKKITLLK
jgi:hypothetical protein